MRQVLAPRAMALARKLGGPRPRRVGGALLALFALPAVELQRAPAVRGPASSPSWRQIPYKHPPAALHQLEAGGQALRRMAPLKIWAIRRVLARASHFLLFTILYQASGWCRVPLRYLSHAVCVRTRRLLLAANQHQKLPSATASPRVLASDLLPLLGKYASSTCPVTNFSDWPAGPRRSSPRWLPTNAPLILPLHFFPLLAPARRKLCTAHRPPPLPLRFVLVLGLSSFFFSRLWLSACVIKNCRSVTLHYRRS